MQYDYPTTVEYLKYLAKYIFKDVINSRDNTIITLPGQGTDALILSLINTRSLPFAPTPILINELGSIAGSIIFIPINLKIIHNRQELIEQVIFALENNASIKFPLNNLEKLSDITKLFTYLTNQNLIIVFIFSTILTYSEINSEILTVINFLQNLNTNKIRLIYSFNTKQGPFVKFTYIKPLPEKDCLFQLARLCNKYKKQIPSKVTTQQLVKLSCGLGAFLKKQAMDYIAGDKNEFTWSDLEFEFADQIIEIISNKDKAELLNGGKLGINNYLHITGADDSLVLLELLRKRLNLKQRGTFLDSRLTATQRRIFDIFTQNESKIISRDDIAKAIWGADFAESYSDWTIDRHIANLRKKSKQSYQIETIKGRGFILNPV